MHKLAKILIFVFICLLGDEGNANEFPLKSESSVIMRIDTATQLADFNNNGIPDIFEDFDGRGMPTVFRDFNGSGIPDFLEDFNGDGQPDALKTFSNTGIPIGLKDFTGNGIPDAFDYLNAIGIPRAFFDSNGDGIPDGFVDNNMNGISDAFEVFSVSSNPLITLDLNNNLVPDIFETGGSSVPFDSQAGTFGAMSVRVYEAANPSSIIRSDRIYFSGEFVIDWTDFLASSEEVGGVVFRVTGSPNSLVDFQHFDGFVDREVDSSLNISLSENGAHYIHLVPVLLTDASIDTSRKTVVRILRDSRAPFLRSPTHPRSDRSYLAQNINIEWLPFHLDSNSVLRYYFIWGDDPDAVPDKSSPSTTNLNRAFLFQPLGEYFFHLRAEDLSGNLSEVSRLKVMVGEPEFFTLSTSYVGQGRISPENVDIWRGEEASIQVVPADGFVIADLILNGDSIGIQAQVTIVDRGYDQHLKAVFERSRYLFELLVGQNGNVSPQVETVEHGADVTFTITPNTGYRVAEVLVDGVSVGAVESYTFENVTAPHTLSASFARRSYTINTTVRGNGTISRQNPSVLHGDNLTITFTAASGHEIDDVLVNGTSAGAKTSHTFSNVTSNQSLEVVFGQQRPPVAAVAANDIFLVQAGDFVTLDAGPSSDPRGGALLYYWREMQNNPVVGLISNRRQAQVQVRPWWPGVYHFELVVENSQGLQSAPLPVTVRVPGFVGKIFVSQTQRRALVSNATVTVDGQSVIATSNDDGEFVLPARDTWGVLTYRVSREGYLNFSQSGVPVVYSARPVEINLQAQSGNRWTGKIVDAVTQQGVSSATLDVMPGSGYTTLTQGGTGASRGDFNLENPPYGQHQVVISHPNYQPMVFNIRFPDQLSGRVIEIMPVTQQISRKLHGYVYAVGTSLPVGGVRIELEGVRDFNNQRLITTSRSDGYYEITGVPVGQYRLVATVNYDQRPDMTFKPYVSTITVLPGTDHEHNISMAGGVFGFYGSVVDANGRPIFGAQLVFDGVGDLIPGDHFAPMSTGTGDFLAPMSTGSDSRYRRPVLSSSSDETGFFSLQLPEGVRRIRVEAPGFATRWVEVPIEGHFRQNIVVSTASSAGAFHWSHSEFVADNERWNAIWGQFQLYDAPYIFSHHWRAWIYPHGESEQTGYYFHDMATGDWCWTTHAIYPHFYNFSQREWQSK